MHKEKDPELERLRERRKAKRIEDITAPPEPTPAGGVITLSDADFKNAVDRHDTLVVDFWAEWCMPCHAMSPILEELVQKHPDVTVGKMNVDMNPKTPGQFGISGIPTLIFFKGGKMVKRVVGVVPLAQLEKVIEGLKTAPED